MQAKRSTMSEIRDLDYRCHFIGSSGVVEAIRLFSSPDDDAQSGKRLNICANGLDQKALSFGRMIV